MKKERKSRRPNISAEEFIKVWQTSSSLAEVCERLGRPPVHMSARASQYRRKGIALKSFGRGGPVDWDAMAAFAASLVESK